MRMRTSTCCAAASDPSASVQPPEGTSPELLSTIDEPNHDDLCEREQRYLLRAIDEDLDLSAHMNDAVKSLRIVLAADESVRTGKVVAL